MASDAAPSNYGPKKPPIDGSYAQIDTVSAVPRSKSEADLPVEPALPPDAQPTDYGPSSRGVETAAPKAKKTAPPATNDAGYDVVKSVADTVGRGAGTKPPNQGKDRS
jgi:hypothetical protein